MKPKTKFKFGEHVTFTYNQKAIFICQNKLQKDVSWVFFPDIEDIESVRNIDLKRDDLEEFFNLASYMRGRDDAKEEFEKEVIKPSYYAKMDTSSIKNEAVKEFASKNIKLLTDGLNIDIIKEKARADERQKCERYRGFTAEEWESQFTQAKMVIDDIKKITGCESDDGLEIVESVSNIKEKIFAELEGARRCLHFKGFHCSKKDCLRFICPIHLKFEENLKQKELK